MRLPIQLQGVIFYKYNSEIYFLAMKRSEKRGGFWQTVTGGLEEGETLRECLLREIEEETQIKKIKKIIDLNYSFQFNDNVQNIWLTEYVFAIELENKVNPILSYEHNEFKWVKFEEAIKLFKYDGTKKGLRKVIKVISK